MRPHLPLAFVGIALISAASIMYWGFSKDDDELFERDRAAYERLDLIDSTITDFRVADFDARRGQEVLVVADDLIDWANAASEEDSLDELFITCDGVLSSLLLLDTSPPQASHVRGVATVCAEVQDGVSRKSPEDWASRIRAEIPAAGYPYSGQGRPSVLARWERLRIWAEGVVSARDLDTDYVRRFCVREGSVGFGLPIGDVAERQDAVERADELREICETLEASSPIVLAERIGPDREIPGR